MTSFKILISKTVRKYIYVYFIIMNFLSLIISCIHTKKYIPCPFPTSPLLYHTIYVHSNFMSFFFFDNWFSRVSDKHVWLSGYLLELGKLMGDHKWKEKWFLLPQQIYISNSSFESDFIRIITKKINTKIFNGLVSYGML